MKVLVVVDMQHDFIDGPLGTKEARAIVPNVKRKIEDAAGNGDYIIFTRDTHDDEYLYTNEGKALPIEHCKHGSKGWTILEELIPPNDYPYLVYDKHTFADVKLPSKILAHLVRDANYPDCDEIELIGVCTDICVVSNALLLKAAFYDDLTISVDATCCAGVTPETHAAALKTMEMCQINVKRG